MLNLQQVANDFEKKYAGTYAQAISVGRDPYIVKIENVEYNEGECFITIRSQEFGITRIKYDTDELELDFTMFPLGYFNYNGFAIYSYRSFERQWKRGMCPGTMRFLNPMAKYSSHAEKASINHSTLVYLRDVKYLKLTEVIELLRGNYIVSIAVRPDWMLSKDIRKDSEVSLLWYRNLPVATVPIVGEPKVIVKEPFMLQEINDFLQDNGELVWLQ